MNILKLKSILFSLMAIAMVTVFLSSCKKDFSEDPLNPEQELVNSDYEIDEPNIPTGNFISKLTLKDEKGFVDIALISVSTNNEEIYKQFTSENFKAELITLAESEKLANENVEDIDERSENVDESLLNTDEHFFTVNILEEYLNDDVFIKYTFGSGLLSVLKKYKAKTYFQFSPESSDALESRNRVFANAFTAYGDGGSVKTKLRIGIDYCGGLDWFYNTNSGFYNYYAFKTCQWPFASRDTKRYTTFTVTQDVLESFYRYNTYTCKKCI